MLRRVKKNQPQKDLRSYDSAYVTFTEQLKYRDGKHLVVRGTGTEASVAVKESHEEELPSDASSVSRLWWLWLHESMRVIQ